MAKIICCDLNNKTGEAYGNFIKAIQKHESCCQITESCWVISTPESTKQVRDTLTLLIDPQDRLFVANLEKGSGAWIHTIESGEILRNILKS